MLKKICLKTAKTAIVISLVIAALAGALMLGIWLDGRRANSDEYTRKRITDYTGIEIPTDARIEYRFYQQGFQDITQYTAFDFESEPAGWLKENSFSEGKSEDFETSFASYFKGWIKDRVPEEYRPEFENSYLYLETKVNFLIYDSNKLTLIVYITGF